MDLDWKLCSRARLARDARFDGKFFIAVLSTKIYCRPICRTRTLPEKSVCYFPTAAAAAEAGFRPCLLCRPECSPGTAVLAGTKNTVSRALRLINDTGLGEGGVEALAERLGVGSRHLRRLFLRHLGASPSAVAKTRRLQFAKRLIDDTRLPMTQIALCSGFGCVRRFNAAMSTAYHLTPTQIRAVAPQLKDHESHQYFFSLSFRPPYAWQPLLDVFAAQATPGVEGVKNGSYRRSISLNGAHGYLQVSLNRERNALDARVDIDEPSSLFFVIERIRSMFDLNADWSIIDRALSSDPALALRIRAKPGLRVPGCWNGFDFTVRTILGHETGAARATALAGQMVKAFGRSFRVAPGLTHLFPTPQRLATADLEGAGLPKSRSEAIRALARAVIEGRVSFEQVIYPEAVLAELSDLLGLTDRTLQYIALRALREPDAFPVAEGHLTGAFAPPCIGDIEKRSQQWRPWRGYAALYLDESLHEFR